MRILHISSAKTFGSGERHLVDLCRELVRRGHDVFVALRPTNDWQEKLDFLPADNFLHTSIRNSFGMFSTRRINRFLEKQQIEIVHAHIARDYLTASIAARSSKYVKLVLTRHVALPLKPFHRFALRNVEAAIGVSPAIGQELAKIFPAEKVRVIANGIDIGPSASTESLGGDFRRLHGIRDDVPLVATLGELKLAEGQRDFVLAANQVVKHFPDCHFLVAGRDNSLDQRFRRELKRLVRVLGLDQQFSWLNRPDDISPLIAAADIFVSPSHAETFGLAILEAMAGGKAVVATDTYGARELIPDPGALSPVKDPIALADKILWYLQNKDERLKLGETLQDTTREKFGLERMVEATEGLYLSILHRQP